jgi:hypothetical protein
MVFMLHFKFYCVIIMKTLNTFNERYYMEKKVIQKERVTTLLRLDGQIISDLDFFAKRKNMSRNAFMTYLLQQSCALMRESDDVDSDISFFIKLLFLASDRPDLVRIWKEGNVCEK